jgi:uncharacterized repeat protein (TIGR03803 family)
MLCLPTRRALLTNPGLRATSAALALAFVLGLGVAQAQTFSILHTFTDTPDGANTPTQKPSGGLIRDAAGNLYGTTRNGGAGGGGTVFKVDTSDTETVLYSFMGYPDGSNPEAPVIRDAAGNFYGTTEFGGPGTLGTVFKLDTTGKETMLYSFDWTHGRYPDAGLVRDSAGNLYGTTDENSGAFQNGTVFKLDTAGKKTVLYRFRGGKDGSIPFGMGLVIDSARNLYGTTWAGGGGPCTQNGISGCGTVFKVTKTGKETVLHRFTAGTDGAYPSPYSTLIRDTNGNFYGITYATVFKVSKSGKFTVLFINGTNGVYPGGTLVRDAKGNLYGPGGNQVFKLDTTGKGTVLYTFTGGTDGAYPYGPLVLDTAGNLYGVTGGGGLPGCGDYGAGCGVVFKIAP